MEYEALVSSAMGGTHAAMRAALSALFHEVGLERSRELLADAAAATPASSDLGRVAAAVQDAADLESLTRPLLEALHDVTGLSSTYLTVVHAEQDVQEIRYSLNSSEDFEVPEGLHVRWQDTLCKRALDSGQPATVDAAAMWADSEPARDLGIQTYVSVPVRLADGSMWGTLCGADGTQIVGAERHLPTMGMFARLIASEVQRAVELAEAQRVAEVDPLTGCATRHGIEQWLREASRTADVVAAVFVDLDRFKQVNDVHGHAAGDDVLREVGLFLRTRRRDGDLVGRLGGDEFVVAAALSEDAVPGFLTRWGDHIELIVDVAGQSTLVEGSVGTAVVRPHEVGELLTRADRAMYDVKRARAEV